MMKCAWHVLTKSPYICATWMAWKAISTCVKAYSVKLHSFPREKNDKYVRKVPIVWDNGRFLWKSVELLITKPYSTYIATSDLRQNVKCVLKVKKRELCIPLPNCTCPFWNEQCLKIRFVWTRPIYFLKWDIGNEYKYASKPFCWRYR